MSSRRWREEAATSCRARATPGGAAMEGIARGKGVHRELEEAAPGIDGHRAVPARPGGTAGRVKAQVWFW